MKFNSKILLFCCFSFNGGLLYTAEQKESSEDTIFKAIESTDPKKVMDFISTGIDLETKDIDGQTPLIRAVWLAREVRKTMCGFLSIDPEVEERRFQGLKEEYLNLIKIINIFLMKGADLNVIDNEGKTAFNYAKFDPKSLRMLNEFDELRKSSIKNALDQSLIRDLTFIVCDY